MLFEKVGRATDGNKFWRWETA